MAATEKITIFAIIYGSLSDKRLQYMITTY